MMTHRERILAVLDRKPPDRIPWAPRLQLWYNARAAEGNLPARYRGMSLREMERAMGVATPAREGRVFRTRYEGLEVRRTAKGGQILTEFITPVGTVSQLDVQSDTLEGYADSGLPIEHPIKRVEDYGVMEYITEHTYFDPAYDDYLAYEQQIGDDGYPMVSVGDCPFHHFLLRLSGYHAAYYELADHLPQVEHLIQVMEQVEMARLWPVVLDSPARLILHGIHFDSQMTPPKLFERYITPYYRQITPQLHARGKVLTYHADDDSKLILEQVRDAGFDMAECFATAPLVTVTLEEARRAWGNDVIIFGGVPSIILEQEVMSDAEFEAYMRDVFRTIAPGDAMILGVSDNVMPRAKIERIERITQMVQEFGQYPISKD